MAIVEAVGVVDPARKSSSENKMKDVKRKCAVPARGGGKPDLMDVRVVQRRLVYAVGLSADICSDQALKSTDFFGKYGKIKKISVTWSNHASPARQATAAAYVLFHTEEDAWNCIQAIDGVKWSGKQVRACFGTTKYCHAYLRNVACTNAECSYLHEPAPEEDTVTKEEMNPMTGRKEVLQLVYPGGVPRGVSKISYKGARGATVPPSSCDGSPSPPTESAAQTPSKSPPSWAIPAPGSKEAVMADMAEGTRDMSPDSSPQFVIPTAAPAAWPSLTEIASGRAESLLARASSGGGGVRPSAKDVVTGSAAASKAREAPKKVMLPLVVAGGRARGARLAAAKDAGMPPSPTEDKVLPEGEHALSTMPSSELSSSRARLEAHLEGVLDAAGSPRAMPHAAIPPGLLSAGDTDAAGAGGGGPHLPCQEDADSVGEGSAEADKENTADTDGEVFTPRSAPPSSAPEGAGGQDSPDGTTPVYQPAAASAPEVGMEISGALSARDLLPASLEDILEDPVADLQPRAASENGGGGAEKAGGDFPRPSLDSHVVMPARRKQSRFAFATTPAGKASSLSLPHDLDSMNAPAVAPEALTGQAGRQGARTSVASPTRAASTRAAFDRSMLPDDIMQALYGQQEQPSSAAVAAATAATVAANARMHAAVAPGTLEQPPMTHESVVQAVSAQLQAIMSQGNSGGWTSHPKVPEQPAPEPLPAAELQMLQALLCQELGNTAARAQEQRGARLPLRGAGNTSMQHLQASPAPSAGRHHGLPIKRTSPQVPLKLDGRSSYTMQPTQRVPPISQLHRVPPSQTYGPPPHSAALVSSAYEAQQYLAAASHAAQHSRSAVHLPMDGHAQARLRAAQQQMTAPYAGADAAYLPDASYYGGWEGSAASDMYSMAGMRAAPLQHQAFAGARQASWPRRTPAGLYWE